MKNRFLLFLFLISLSLSANSNDDFKAMKDFMLLDAKTPASVILESLNENKTVNIIATPGYTQTIDFFRYLVPALSHSGINNLGVWFLNSSDQTAINQFLQSRPGSPNAKELLFSGNPSWGYIEYADFLDYVRRFNLSAGEDDEIFILTALSGNESEIDSRINWIYAGFDDNLSLENSSDFEIMSPIPGENGHKAKIPYNGFLDNLIYQIPDWKRYAAVPLKGNPLWTRQLQLIKGKEPDFLIIMGLAEEFIPVTPINNFIKQEDLYRVKDEIPELRRINPIELGTALANARIRAYIRNLIPEKK